MKIMFLADVESKALWDYFRKEDFADIDLIVSCGDLKASYLSFLATMTGCDVLYVRGNHDYKYKTAPPEGCICIEDRIYEYKGVRFLGFGGSMRYKPGICQYTEKEMAGRAKSVGHAIRRKGGFDVLVTHAPAAGINDGQDLCHQGFECFKALMDRYKPKYFVHGHIHMNYGRNIPRLDSYGDTQIVNAYEKYVLEIDEEELTKGRKKGLSALLKGRKEI